MEGVYFTNSLLIGWSIQEGGHFARVRYFSSLISFLWTLLSLKKGLQFRAVKKDAIKNASPSTLSQWVTLSIAARIVRYEAAKERNSQPKYQRRDGNAKRGLPFLYPLFFSFSLRTISKIS